MELTQRPGIREATSVSVFFIGVSPIEAFNHAAFTEWEDAADFAADQDGETPWKVYRLDMKISADDLKEV